MSNAIKNLWDWNKELAFKVEFQVSLIEQSNREKAEAEAKGKKALTPEPSNGVIDWEGYQKALSKTRLCDELIASFALELVALLKAEALPKSTVEPVIPPTNDAPMIDGDLVHFRDDAHARTYLGLPPARDPLAPSFPKMLAMFERLAHEEEIL